jgi:hypothetical protein
VIERPRGVGIEELCAVVVRIRRGEAGGIATKVERKPFCESRPDGVAHSWRRGSGYEQEQPRPPVMIGGDLVVVAEDFGARPDERRGVAEIRES